jgi:hypothetical protein
MTYQNTTTGSEQTHTKAIQASDIKSLIQKQGKTTINNKEFVLKSPSSTDPKLQEIIKDPSFAVKTVGATSATGESEYELNANGKSVKIKVECKNCH